MWAQHAVFLPLVLLLISFESHAVALDLESTRPHGDPGFDLLLLVRTWPPTFCEQIKEEREECTLAPLQDFTLHGLWPEYSTGGWPQYCAHETASESETDSDDDLSFSGPFNGVEDDDSKARCEWPSYHGATASFWNHEWTKHGTCAEPLLGNRTEFFKSALQLHEKYDLNRLFLSKGIWPAGNRQGSFESSHAEEVVTSAWGVKPKLACHKGSLSEVWLCLNLDLELIECPEKVRPGAGCGSQFRMPPGAEPSSQCQRFFPNGNDNWMNRLGWPEGLGIVTLIGGMIAIYMINRRESAPQGDGYAPLGTDAAEAAA